MGEAPRYGRLLICAIDFLDRSGEIRQSPEADSFLVQANAILSWTRHGRPGSGSGYGMGSVRRVAVDGGSGPRRAKEAVRSALEAAAQSGAILSAATDVAMYEGRCALREDSTGAELFLGSRRCEFLMDQVKTPVFWNVNDSGFEEAWVPRFGGGQTLVEPWILFSRNEALTLTGLLAGLVTAARDTSETVRIIQETIRATTGSPMLPGETVLAYIVRQFQLPDLNAPVLQFEPEALRARLAEDREFSNMFLKEVGRSLERLGLAAAGQSVDTPLTWDRGLGRWVRPPPERIPAQKRWLSSPGVEMYGWLPLSLFPGGLAAPR
jgi:hypothetical protein